VNLGRLSLTLFKSEIVAGSMMRRRDRFPKGPVPSSRPVTHRAQIDGPNPSAGPPLRCGA